MKTSRLTSSQKSQILEKYRLGESSSQLAKEFECSPNTVSRTVKSLMSDGEYKRLKAGRIKARALKNSSEALAAEEPLKNKSRTKKNNSESKALSQLCRSRCLRKNTH